MDKEFLKNRIAEIDKRLEQLEEERARLKDERNGCAEELSYIYAELAYGLKVGDRIRFEKKNFRKSEVITIQITEFGVNTTSYLFGVDVDEMNKKPSIHGVRILKNGEVGTKKESWWAHKKVPFEVVQA